MESYGMMGFHSFFMVKVCLVSMFFRNFASFYSFPTIWERCFVVNGNGLGHHPKV